MQNIICCFSKIDEKNKEINFLKKKEEYIKKINFTYFNASLNTIILGATGSGKTKSLILNFLYSFLKKKIGGLIIDIKNDITNDIKKLAKQLNRENDIIEIGSFETSDKINLINGINKEELKSLIEKVFNNENQNVTDPYWNNMGLKVVFDIIDVLFYIKKYDKIEISFYLLYLILTNENIKKSIFTQFLNTPYSKEKEEILNNIKSYKFHHLYEPDNDEIRREKEKQKNWTYERYIFILKKLIEDNLLENINNIFNIDFKLDFKELLYEKKKILIVRFDYLRNSYIGNLLTSFIREKMISDIIKYNSNILEEKRKETFIIIDEFQNIVSFNKNFNDNYWFDKSRSFKCYQIVATQSLSSLYSTTNNYYNIKTLLNNCRNKFFLMNDDPVTNEYFLEISQNFNINKPLNLLKQGECYYYYYDEKERKNNLELIKLNLDIYNKIKNI